MSFLACVEPSVDAIIMSPVNVFKRKEEEKEQQVKVINRVLSKQQPGVEIQRPGLRSWSQDTWSCCHNRIQSGIFSLSLPKLCSQLLHTGDSHKSSSCIGKVNMGGCLGGWMSRSTERMWSLESRPKGPLFPSTSEELIDAANTTDWLLVTAPFHNNGQHLL